MRGLSLLFGCGTQAQEQAPHRRALGGFRKQGKTQSLRLQSYLLRRWDWGGCQEGPVIPSEEVLLEVKLPKLR